MLKQIGKYTISEKLGRGALSRIYRASDPHGRHVAIKLSTTQPHPAQFDQFQKDMVSASSVLQENLIKVYDLGSEDGFPYLVVEFVDGRDLSRIIKTGGRLSLAAKVRAMLQVAEALRAAHERGISHLDVRPSKVILSQGGDVKLLGLGQARLSYDPSLDTENGYLIGQPFYMAPERFNAIELADEPCDIWSFGVTFYELVAGIHPFHDDDGERMIDNIMHSDHSDIPNVPDSLNRLLRRTLEKDRSARYSTFSSVIEDARSVLAELEREESDTLMAQALQQTDSGRWSEARRLARKIQESSPDQAPGSSLFGLSEVELERMRSAERQSQPAAAAVATPAPVAVAPLDEDAIEEEALLRAAPAPVPSLARSIEARSSEPERNGSTVRPDGVAVATVRPQNGLKVAAAAASAAAVATPPPVSRPAVPPPPAPQRVARTQAPPASETPATPRPAPSATRNRRVISPTYEPPAVSRVLQAPDSGLPWGKIVAVLAVLAVLGGAFFFLVLKPSSPKPASDADAKTTRIIKAEQGDDSNSHAGAGPMDVTPTTPPPAAASNKQAELPATSATNANSDAANAANPAPKPFDASVLRPVKPETNKGRKGAASPLARLAPPSAAGAVPAADDSALALPVVSAPPPPAPVAKPAPVAAAAPQPAAPTFPSKTEAKPLTAAERPGGAFTEPVLLLSVQPVYPPSALQHKAQGIVRFQATITKDGSVKDLQLVAGDPYLNMAAKTAVMKWKYRPATLNGQPIEVTQAIVVKFNLN